MRAMIATCDEFSDLISGESRTLGNSLLYYYWAVFGRLITCNRLSCVCLFLFVCVGSRHFSEVSCVDSESCAHVAHSTRCFCGRQIRMQVSHIDFINNIINDFYQPAKFHDSNYFIWFRDVVQMRFRHTSLLWPSDCLHL